MANDAEKKSVVRRAKATRNVALANILFLAIFFLLRFLLRPQPLFTYEWVALLVTLCLLAATSFLYISGEAAGTPNDGATDVLGMGLAALLFAAFDRRGWIFALLAPFVAAIFICMGARSAVGSIGKLTEKAAVGQARAIASGVKEEGKGARRR